MRDKKGYDLTRIVKIRGVDNETGRRLIKSKHNNGLHEKTDTLSLRVSVLALGALLCLVTVLVYFIAKIIINAKWQYGRIKTARFHNQWA